MSATEKEIAGPGTKGNLRIESVPFDRLFSQPRLFLEYQSDPLRLRKYYPSAVETHTEIADRIPEVLAAYKTDRNEICDALDAINRDLSAGEQVFRNIDLLRQPNSVAVVTGQQAGLFTGPIYTIYKALSAVRAAECLTARGFKAVPVFWAATEDHDFPEAASANVLDRAGRLAKVACEPSHTEDISVGRVELDRSIDDSIELLFASLKSTEFSSKLQAEVRTTWSSSESWGRAFGRMLSTLTAEYGLVIIDPLDKRIKRLASPIYVEAITMAAQIVAAVRSRSDELIADGFEAQVEVGEDYFPLFRHSDDGRRVPLRKATSGVYNAKGGNGQFSIDQLAESAATDPCRFSPGVILRPVVQDYLLPTVCYLGGAAEVAYFAQNSEVYRVLGRPVTPILHRQSFTVIESKHARTMKRFDLELTDLFRDRGELVKQIVENYLDRTTARTFAEVEENVNTELNRLDRELSVIDPTLAENLSTRRRKMLYHIAALRRKFHDVEVRKDETANRQLESMFEALLPNGTLQERVLNITFFLNQYGPRFVEWIYRAIDLDDKSHRLIYL
jgi:bacillithiol biosynthesis cysteine-adding enzyme BshC